MSSVAKIFQILETVVAHQARGLAYSEVVARTSLAKATAHRFLKSLVAMGYLRFDREAGRYFGDLKLAVLGSAVTSHFDLKEYVRPYLQELHADTRHTCHLGIRNGKVGVYVEKLESSEGFGFKLFSAVGKSFPLHCTAMGKVLLAGLEAGQRTRLLQGRLPPYTPNTITSRAVLAKELQAVREAGYAVDREEITRGIMCVAAPLVNHEGEVIAAISLTFPAYIAKDRGIGREIQAVRRGAAAITEALRTSRAV
jgi:DNA-binding IclR family transcriptional regulator